jgi:conjugal transfer ATP-binding protein TraC
MFPFSSSALTMPAGVLYGIATASHSPVLIDPFDRSLENSNLAIFATSGAGKSFFCKLLLLRSRLRGIDAIVIDPEDEYRALCRALEGQYVRLASTSGQHLNPFDLPLDDAFLELMLAELDRPLSNQERGLLDRALHQTYAEAGIQRGRPATYGRPAPLLRDLYGVLTRSEDAVARGLASRLERYVLGSLAGLFAGPTNVALDSRFLVFNLQRLERELQPLAIHAITAFVWNRVRQEVRPRLLVVDEAWSLLQYEQGAAFLGAMARRARKYALGLVTITQDVADALGNAHGRTVLTNAACTLLLKQSSSTIGPVAEAFALSDEERHYLLGAAKGEGLLFCRNTHLALHVVASAKEYALATSAPQDRTAGDVAQSSSWMDPEGGTRPPYPGATKPDRWHHESEG